MANENSLKKLDDSLKLAIKEEKRKQAPESSKKQSDIGIGMRISIEMVVSVVAGGGLGLLIDKMLDTGPIFMIIFVFLGFAAGLMNTYRVVKGLDEAVGLGRAIREKNPQTDELLDKDGDKK